MKAENGDILIAVNGDRYEGDKSGISVNADFSSGKRTGGVIMSKQAYGPGVFEAVMKLPSVNGVCSSIWLYETTNEELYNHEIDIEIFGTVRNDYGLCTYGKVLCSSYQTVGAEAEHSYVAVPNKLNDGEFHKYRIEWHTGANARVEFYIDDVKVCTLSDYVPTGEMYLNIGCWLPNGWCGDPDFETDNMIIRSFGYTPFTGESATEVSRVVGAGEQYRAIASTGRGFESNLVANGTLSGDRADFEWRTVSGSVADGVLNGTIEQDVFIDCGGLQLDLAITGSGNATVVVEYGSAVDGVTVSGSQAFEFSGGASDFTLAPPAGCTKLTIRITSNGGALSEIKLGS